MNLLKEDRCVLSSNISLTSNCVCDDSIFFLVDFITEKICAKQLEWLDFQNQYVQKPLEMSALNLQMFFRNCCHLPLEINRS